MLDYSIRAPLALPYHLCFMVGLAEEGPLVETIKCDRVYSSHLFCASAIYYMFLFFGFAIIIDLFTCQIMCYALLSRFFPDI
jgi:hypothetical protein